MNDSYLMEKVQKFSLISLSNLESADDESPLLTSKNIFQFEESMLEAAKKLELVKQQIMKNKKLMPMWESLPWTSTSLPPASPRSQFVFFSHKALTFILSFCYVLFCKAVIFILCLVMLCVLFWWVLQEALEGHDGVSKGKYTIGLGQDCMAFCSEVDYNFAWPISISLLLFCFYLVVC